MCNMENFCKTLAGHVAILSATVTQKKKFHRLLAGDHPEFGGRLQLVEIGDWAGLGGVRYIPEVWSSLAAHRMSGHNENAAPVMMEPDRELIDQVNQQLVAKLRASDSAFSLGNYS